MAITVKRITMRQGNAADWQPEKMISGELAVINDGKELHYCYADGQTIRVATEEDLENIESVKRTKADGIFKVVYGREIEISDASNEKMRSLRVFGKSTQSATPTPDAPQEITDIEGATVTVTDEQTIEIDKTLKGVQVIYDTDTSSSMVKYVDENGQKWCSDEMDYKNGKYIQRINSIILDESKNYELQSVNSNNIANFVYYLPATALTSNYGMCSHLPIQTSGIADTTSSGFLISQNNMVYIRLSTDIASTVDELKTYLTSQKTEGTPVVFNYILATPVETDIANEIPYTVYPNTTISSDAWMEVEYLADTKLYVDAIGNSGQDIIVDTALSTESENPVQNKVVAARINELSEQIASLVDGNEVEY